MQIDVHSLTKDYGNGKGVFDVTFSVNSGEVFGFLGPNGAGKSTTIRHLMGFSKPQSGYTKILGLDSFHNYDKLLKEVGYIPGEVALPSGLTGWEFIEMMKKLKGVTDNKKVEELLDIFEVDPSGETKRMSLGNKRKLAIVAAFLNDPQILILDEPTSGLDPVMQEKFVKYIKEEKRKGKTILLSSHIFSEVEELCDRVAIIKDGKIVDQFPMSKFKYAKDKVYKIRFARKKDVLEVKKKLEKIVDEIVIGDSLLTVHLNDANINQFIDVIKDYMILDFSHEMASLEAYFMNFYVEDRQYRGIES